VLNELRRVPRPLAALLVIGSAAVTMLVLAAVDGGGGSSERPAGTTPDGVLELGKSFPQSKPSPPPRAGSTKRKRRPAPAKIPLRRLVGQKLVVRMRGVDAPPGLLRHVRRGEVGGVILFPDNVGSASQLRSLTGRLRAVARAGGSAGFVVAVDQEGGPVKRLQAGPPTLAPAQIGTPAEAARQGRATGDYLRGLGVNVDLAPVLDVRRPGSFVANRAFAATPAAVSRLGGAFARGLQAGGVAATAKHFPGLGQASANTDVGASVVGASRQELDADLVPFADAARGGVALVMMSNATYPAYARGPAVLSRQIVQGQLRGRLGFDGVIVSDDLEAGAIRAVTSPADASVAAAEAGVDVFLLARSPASYDVAYRALLAAARDGRLDRAALEQSYSRIERLQSTFGR
jgi:beta-N-acetylhexosaminidase